MFKRGIKHMSRQHVQIEIEIPEGRTLEFELNPFISQIVLWNDREIIRERPLLADVHIDFPPRAYDNV
jgi:hypothetical protein